MDRILFLECSPHASDSQAVQQVLATFGDLECRNPRIRVTTRSLTRNPLAPLSAQYAKAITSSAPHDDAAFTCSERLIGELESCDGLLITTPMHNFTVPAALKLWIDHVMRKGRSFKMTAEGKVGLLPDRPALVLVSSGSPCNGANARQPDFLTPYLRHVLSVLGIHSVQFIYLPGQHLSADALAQVRQALASFLIPSPLTGDFA